MHFVVLEISLFGFSNGRRGPRRVVHIIICRLFGVWQCFALMCRLRYLPTFGLWTLELQNWWECKTGGNAKMVGMQNRRESKIGGNLKLVGIQN